MSLIFHDTTIHILDTSLDQPLLSTTPLILTDETEGFVTSHIVKLSENMSSCTGQFTEESILWPHIQPESYDFMTFSETLATLLYSVQQQDEALANGDLVVTDFTRDGIHYVGFFKLTYKEAFTHLVDQTSEGLCTTLIKHKTIFSDSAGKVQEAVLINFETHELLILDLTRSKYLKDLLGFTASLTTKEKIKVAEHVINEAIEENFDNKIEAKSFAKNNIAKSINHSSAIMLDAILEETFGEHEELVEQCLKKCENFGLTEKTIELPKAEQTFKKYSSSKLKTNTGIEIKLPSEMLHDNDCIEFINNPDGTLSIMLKNIAELINK